VNHVMPVPSWVVMLTTDVFIPLFVVVMRMNVPLTHVILFWVANMMWLTVTMMMPVPKIAVTLIQDVYIVI
jgi:hypothetical protein